MNDIIQQAMDGQYLVIAENGVNILGPFNSDDDAQYALHEMQEHGLKATAIKIMGHNI